MCVWERQKTLEEGEEVVSDLSQSGIRVYLGFVGGLRKGICNFPPLIYTSVYNSYLSPLPLGSFVLIFLFYPSDFNMSYLNVIADIVFMQRKRLCALFEACTWEITRFWLFFFKAGLCVCWIKQYFFAFPPFRYPSPWGAISTAQTPWSQEEKEKVGGGGGGWSGAGGSSVDPWIRWAEG